VSIVFAERGYFEQEDVKTFQEDPETLISVERSIIKKEYRK
jgi:hypothetical protein